MSFIQAPLTLNQMVGITTSQPTPQELLIQVYRQVYEGDQEVKLESRQQDYIITGNDLPNSLSNMVKLVIEKIKNRTKVKRNGEGIRASDEESNDFADFATKQWQQGNIDAEQSELMTYVLRDGLGAFFTEWPDGSDLSLSSAKETWCGGTEHGGQYGVRFHSLDARNDVVDFASYRWPVTVYDAEGKEQSPQHVRMNLYVRGREGLDGGNAVVYRLYSADGDTFIPLGTEPQAVEGSDETIPSMMFLDTGADLPNPQVLETPDIPVIKYENVNGESEVRALIKLQNLRDKGITDLDSASDYHAMPALASDELPGNEEPVTIQPGYLIAAPNAKRIEGANLELMWAGMLRPYLMEMGTLKNFPVWVLNPQDNAVPSGKALEVQERDFVQMIRDKQDKLTVAWQSTFYLIREYANLRTNNNFPDTARLSFEWVNPATENITEIREAEVRTAKEAGQSEETIWRDVYGYTDEQVEEEQDRKRQDIEYKKQQADIVQLMTQATLNPDGALDFAGLSDEEQANLTLFGNADVRDVENEQ